MNNDYTPKNIKEYFDFLIEKYNLGDVYNKYLIFLYIFAFTRESFFWILILSSQSQMKDKDKMLRIVYLLFSLLILAAIFENIFLKYKIRLTNSLNKVHLKYCFDLINTCKESEVLSTNLVEQFMYIESVKAGLDSVVQEKQCTIQIFVTFISVIVASKKINVFLVTSLLGVFNSAIYFLQRKNMNLEDDLNEENTELINKIRNYFTESKQKIINNLFNEDYCLNMFDSYFKNNLKLVKIESSINTYNSIMILVITLIIVLFKYKTSSIFDIFIYLMIVYDLDFFVDLLFQFYKIRKSYVKINLHLKGILENKTYKEKIECDERVNTLEIIDLTNRLPTLKLDRPFTISTGDIILCNGKSGEGKTTFLKMIKDIETPDLLRMRINGRVDELNSFHDISSRVFFTVQNNRIGDEESLYNLISNHSPNPDIPRIQRLLHDMCIHHIFTGEKDQKIQTDKLSGGEGMRLNLAQTMYDILDKDYDIILFDEIDVNLDVSTALQIFQNIVDLLKDKILIFIVHNDNLKNSFQKQIIFYNHTIYPTF